MRGAPGAWEPRVGNWRLWGAAIGGWAALSLLLAPEVYLHFLGSGQPIPWGQVMALTFTNTAIAVLGAPAIVWLTRRCPLDHGRRARSLLVHAAACLAFSLAHTSAYWVLCYASGGFLGLLFERFNPSLVTYWAIVAFAEAIRYFEKYRERERQLAHAQLELLKAQLQPHLLFNALNTIAAMMHEDVRAADRMIIRLSDLLRLALENLGRHESTLQHELEFVLAYFEIHRARFGDSLELELDVPPRLRAAAVPSLVLQPIVENAIRHGFPSPGRRGKIRIEAREGPDGLTLKVVDDGQGPPEDPREGLGLGITRRRLEQLYPGRGRLTLENGPSGGAVATLAFPFKELEAAAPPLVGLSGQGVPAS